eukprot:6181555-Pleurochrysis_carterae.AAC.6
MLHAAATKTLILLVKANHTAMADTLIARFDSSGQLYKKSLYSPKKYRDASDSSLHTDQCRAYAAA